MAQRIKDGLIAARGLIADIENWTTDFSAIEKTGAEVHPCSDDAHAWCAIGATDRVAGGDVAALIELYKALTDASLELFGEGILGVNDGILDDYGLPETASSDERLQAQHACVLRAFDLAIERN